MKRFRLPLGRGIAGLVAVTGQPIAVSDVSSDPRHASEIAEQTGYTPQNLLCVPVQSDDRVIGVLELMDKPADNPFNLEDMQRLGSFAAQAAKTIERSRTHHGVVRLVVRGLLERLPVPVNDHDEDAATDQGLELGSLVVDIAERDYSRAGPRLRVVQRQSARRCSHGAGRGVRRRAAVGGQQRHACLQHHATGVQVSVVIKGTF